MLRLNTNNPWGKYGWERWYLGRILSFMDMLLFIALLTIVILNRDSEMVRNVISYLLYETSFLTALILFISIFGYILPHIIAVPFFLFRGFGKQFRILRLFPRDMHVQPQTVSGKVILKLTHIDNFLIYEHGVKLDTFPYIIEMSDALWKKVKKGHRIVIEQTPELHLAVSVIQSV